VDHAKTFAVVRKSMMEAAAYIDGALFRHSVLGRQYGASCR
jgi:hypothetical protein